MTNGEMNEIKKGDVVVFTNQADHYQFPEFFPPPGTKGEVLTVEIVWGDEILFVQWPAGTTSGGDKRLCWAGDVVKEADGSGE